MPTVSVPAKSAKDGVKAATNQLTKIQIRLASLELLVGGPYVGHPYGHTALRVTTAESDAIFDYGRYGRAWGMGNSEGDGVLRVWHDFGAYIRSENALGRVTTGFVFDTSEDNARRVLDFFEQKTAGKPLKNKDAAKKEVIIDTYHALGPNCTTLSLNGLKVVFPDIDRDWSFFQQGRGLGMLEKAAVAAKGWPKHTFMPADLQAMLESPSAARKAKEINKYGAQR